MRRLLVDEFLTIMVANYRKIGRFEVKFFVFLKQRLIEIR